LSKAFLPPLLLPAARATEGFDAEYLAGVVRENQIVSLLLKQKELRKKRITNTRCRATNR
jgi:hypothetical protein